MGEAKAVLDALSKEEQVCEGLGWWGDHATHGRACARRCAPQKNTDLVLPFLGTFLFRVGDKFVQLVNDDLSQFHHGAAIFFVASPQVVPLDTTFME